VVCLLDEHLAAVSACMDGIVVELCAERWE